ncbi:MAG: hypothetical protein ACM336_14740 [Acidobacteriota bacterium]
MDNALKWRQLAVALVLVFVAVAITARSIEAGRTAPPMGLRAADSGGGQLLITWDGSARPVLESRGAVLRIVDGANRMRIDLTRRALIRGRVSYARQSGRVDVSLIVFGGTARRVEEMVSYLGREVAR